MTDNFAGQRISMVRVTNSGDTVFTDRYDGVPYIFAPGQTKAIPVDVAHHLLGFHPGADDKSMFRHVSKRQGWNTPKHIEVGDDGLTLAERQFAALTIEPVVYKMVEEKLDPSKPIPAEPQIITAKDPVPERKGMQ